jgi:hypothetical protein
LVDALLVVFQSTGAFWALQIGVTAPRNVFVIKRSDQIQVVVDKKATRTAANDNNSSVEGTGTIDAVYWIMAIRKNDATTEKQQRQQIHYLELKCSNGNDGQPSSTSYPIRYLFPMELERGSTYPSHERSLGGEECICRLYLVLVGVG